MRLYYYKVDQGNFGDDLNAWLWDALMPGFRDWPADSTLMGVGTILRHGKVPPGHKLVLGSGVGYGAIPDVSDTENWDIRAVRGPRTAKALGLPPEKAYVDGAVMVPRLAEFQNISRGDDVVFVPHFKSVGAYDWPAICAAAGVVYQTPCAEAPDVIRRLASARMVIAESMHAAILADAFGTPWRAVSITAGFNTFKWGDWAESLSMAAPQATQFFAPLRKAQDFVKTLRGTPKADSGPASERKGPAVAENALSAEPEKVFSSGAGKLMPILKPWAVQILKSEAQKTPNLSDRDALARAQDRFQAMIDGVIADYTPTDTVPDQPPLA